MGYAYGLVERVLFQFHAVPPEKEGAFRSRIRHFQRLRFPPGVNTGKGTRADYGAGELTALAIGLELVQLGVTPDRVVRILSEHSALVRRAIHRCAVKSRNREPVLLLVDPASVIDGASLMKIITASEIRSEIETHGVSRFIVVSVSPIVEYLKAWFELVGHAVLEAGMGSTFLTSLTDWSRPSVDDVD